MPIEDQSMKGIGLGILSNWGLGAKPCDSCKSSPALLFCRPDSAFLCGPCDSRIHAANKLASRHERVLVCEVCEQSPAVVTCKADAASLCASCDRDIHSANPLAHRHERLPVVPFFHTPSDLSASAKSSALLVPSDISQPPSVDTADDSWLIPNIQGKLAGADVLCSSDVDSFMDSGYPDFDFKNQVIGQLGNHRSNVAGAGSDSIVPNQTKSQHLNLNNYYNESCFEIDFTKSKLSPFNFSAQCISQSVSSSDFGIVPDGNSNSISEVSDFHLSKSMSAKAGSGGLDRGSAAQPVQLSRIDREARVMRYREKRKNRKFEKTIRYASRKAYAETRPRIKGRFTRRTDADTGADQIYADSGVVGGFLMDDDMYGVVPSF